MSLQTPQNNLIASCLLLSAVIWCSVKCDDLCGGLVALRTSSCNYDLVIALPSDGTGVYNLLVNTSMPIYSNENIRIDLENAEAVQAGTASHLIYVLSHPSCDYYPLITRMVFNGRLVCKNPPYKANSKHAATQFSHESTHYGVVRKRHVPSLSLPDHNQSPSTSPQLQALDLVIGPQLEQRFHEHASKPMETTLREPTIGTNHMHSFPNNPFLASLKAPGSTPPSSGNQPIEGGRFPSRIQSESNQDNNVPQVNPGTFNNNPFLNGQLVTTLTRPPPITARPTDINAVCGYSTYALIQGGSDVQRGEFPWLGALFQIPKNSYLCTVNLVTQKHVLTAAHCFTHPDNYNDYGILWGHPNSRRGQRQYARLRSIQLHPGYNQSTVHDIALVTLTEGVTFTLTLKPICLWRTEATPIKGEERGIVAGFGPDYSDLKKIEFPIVSQEACLSSNHYFHFITSEFTFCAGTRKREEGPCKGDSGAGYMQSIDGRYFLRGLVSHSLSANGNCNLKEFIIFADLSKEMDWVRRALSN